MKVVLGDNASENPQEVTTAGTYYVDFHRKTLGKQIKTICKIFKRREDKIEFVVCGTSKNFPGGLVSKVGGMFQDLDPKFVHADKFNRELGRRKALVRALQKERGPEDVDPEDVAVIMVNVKFTRAERIEFIRQYDEFIHKTRMAGEASQQEWMEKLHNK